MPILTTFKGVNRVICVQCYIQKHVFRCVIRHDLQDVCSKIPGLKKEKLKLKLGIVGAKLFAKLCSNDGKQKDLIQSYLLKFGLAVKLKDGNIFIPSIVSEDNVSIKGHILKQ